MNRSGKPLPALLGGSPTVATGPPAWPIPNDAIREVLEAAYRNGSWGRYHGEFVPQLEAALAQFHGVSHVWTCCSGTFAVELAIRALKIESGDEVILAAYDYPGNFRSVLAAGATPVLVDLDPMNWNIAAGAIEPAIGPKTRAIIASHLHGGIAPIRQIVDCARAHGLAVIEDAAQATGAMIQARRAGTWGDVGILSFGGSKLLTAGRGGCLVTSNPEIHQRAKLYCERGNDVFPLSELQAAVLIPQLAVLDERNQMRRERVATLIDALKPYPCLKPLQNSVLDAQPAYYKLGFQFDYNEAGGMSRELFVAALRAEGVAIDAGFRSAHVGRSPSRYRRAGELTESERAHHCMVVLPHPVLLGGPPDIVQVATAVGRVVEYSHELQSAAFGQTEVND